MTAILKMFIGSRRDIYPNGLRGQKNRFLGLTLKFYQTYLCNGKTCQSTETTLTTLHAQNLTPMNPRDAQHHGKRQNFKTVT